MEFVKKHLLLLQLILCFTLNLVICSCVNYFVDQAITKHMISLIDPEPSFLEYKNGIVICTYVNPFDEAEQITVEDYNYEKMSFWNHIKTGSTVAVYGLGLFIAAGAFYILKLKKPLTILNTGAVKIREQDLEFSMASDKKDELGILCNSYEQMRLTLKDTFEKLWSSEEKRRSIYNAFAHDIRTPITIIRGNQELISYLLQNEGNQEEIRNALEIAEDALKRIELYTQALKEFRDREEWKPDNTPVDLEQLSMHISKQNRILTDKSDIMYIHQCDATGTVIVDERFLGIIMDRIMENEIRFAQSEIKLRIYSEEKKTVFEVRDDGKGFQEEALQKATEMFYSTDKSRGHTGFGLAMAELLLEKMNSHLECTNDDGAVLKFKI